MLLTLLLLAPVAAEWVEISQQYYVKSAHQFNKATNPVHTVEVIKHNSDKSYLNTVGKLSEAIQRPNRIYINNTILQHAFNDDIFIEKQTPTPKLSTRRPVNKVPHKTLHRANTNDKVTTERNAVKPTIKYDKKAMGNKVVPIKDMTRDERPNRIYLLENEYSGSLEVLDWSDLDKLAEEDSKDIFKKTTKHSPSLSSNIDTEATSSHKYNDEKVHPALTIEKGNKIVKKPELASKNSSKIVDFLANTENTAALDTASEKAVTIIQKHMVAKVTRVNGNTTKPPKVEVIEVQNENSTLSQIKDSIRKISNETNAGNKSTITLQTRNLSTTSKPTVVSKNRYKNHVKEEVPDPEEIMIQELLEETKNIELVGGNNNKNENTKENYSEETINEKGTKAPDPDEVMIKEILNAEISTSRRKSTKRPSLNGTFHLLKTSTRTSSTTEKLPSHQFFTKETSSARSNSTKERLDNETIVKVSRNTTQDQSRPFSKQEVKVVKKMNKVTTSTASTLDENASINTPKSIPTETTLYEFIKHENIRKDEAANMKAEENVRSTTPKVISEEITSSQEGSIEINDRSNDYKTKVLLSEPTPEFVSREEFFMESEESVDSNLKENVDFLNQSTLEPVSSENNDNKETASSTNDDTQTPNIRDKSNVNSEPKVKSSETSEKNREKTVNTNEKKENTMENVVKLLKVVTDIISRNTRRGFNSKVRYLEDLKNTLLTNIEERLEATFPTSSARQARSLHAARGHVNSLHATPRGHVDFPSSESALMTISFLTFAVFLIKLVLQVIHSYKNKSLPAVVAAVGRGFHTTS